MLRREAIAETVLLQPLGIVQVLLIENVDVARADERGRQAAQIVAAECVTLAETKDHLNWELLGELAKKATAEESALLTPAYEQVEAEEDEHLYHTAGWTRELWIQALGMPAVLPPPEEKRKVETAIEAAQAKKSRTANTKVTANTKAKKASAR